MMLFPWLSSDSELQGLSAIEPGLSARNKHGPREFKMCDFV